MKVPFFPQKLPLTHITTTWENSAMSFRCHPIVFLAPWLGGDWRSAHSKRFPQCSEIESCPEEATKPIKETNDALKILWFWICNSPTSPQHWNANESVSLAEGSVKAGVASWNFPSCLWKAHTFFLKGIWMAAKMPVPFEACLGVIRLSGRNEYISETFILCTNQWLRLV